MNRCDTLQRAQPVLRFWEVLFNQLLVLRQAAAFERQKQHEI